MLHLLLLLLGVMVISGPFCRILARVVRHEGLFHDVGLHGVDDVVVLALARDGAVRRVVLGGRPVRV